MPTYWETPAERVEVVAADSEQRIFIDSPLHNRSGIYGGHTDAQVTKGVRLSTCPEASGTHRPFGHLCAMLHELISPRPTRNTEVGLPTFLGDVGPQ